jgi:repressor of nif and glnA expression
MNIDAHYLKGLLGVFKCSSTPFTNINKFKEHGFHFEDDAFLFHMQILEDKDLVRSSTGNGIGYTHTTSGEVAWLTRDIRLTSEGHDLASALERNEVWEVIKSEFDNECLTILIKVAIALAENYAMEKLTALITEQNAFPMYSIDMDHGTV